MVYDLSCKYDSSKSFYGKAKIIETRNKNVIDYKLQSYDTIVARLTIIGNIYTYYVFDYEVEGKTSTRTTKRHQKEFFKQYGLSDNEIKELFKNGTLEVK